MHRKVTKNSDTYYKKLDTNLIHPHHHRPPNPSLTASLSPHPNPSPTPPSNPNGITGGDAVGIPLLIELQMAVVTANELRRNLLITCQ